MPIGILVLAVCAWLASDQNLFNDGDTSWHLAAGQWIIDSRSVPDHDPFSFTFRGQPWVAHEWLAEAFMAAIYGALGWAGLALFFSLLLGLTLLLIAHALQRSMPTRYVVVALTFLLLILAPFVLARPHVIGWPLLAGWLLVLLDARERQQAPRLHWSPLMLVWANLHASYIFGLALVGLFALEALLAEPDRRRVLTGWGAFGLASLLMAILTPHGPMALLYPFQVSQMAALSLIQEWRPTRLPEDRTFALFASAILAAVIVRRRSLTAPRLLLIAALAWLAFAHARHQPLFAITSILVLCFTLPPRPQRAFDRVSLSLLAVGLVVIAVVRLSLPMAKADSPTDPVTAISRVSDRLGDQPVLNSYGFGGPLIRNGIAPFIDGRADMYGDRFIIEHQAMVDGDSAKFERARRRWNISWTILAPEARLVAVLDRDLRWRRIYSDRWAVVHARR